MTRRNPAPVGRLLVRAASATRWDRRLPGAAAVVEQYPEALLAAAARHRTAPALWLALRHEPGLPDSLALPLHDAWFGAAGNHLRALRDLAALADALDPAHVRFAVFKGPVLSGLYYPRPDLRPYVDLDVLVDPAGLGPAVHALEAAGFSVLDRNWDRIHQLMLGEIHLKAPGGVLVDLHWQVLNRETVRRPYDLRPGPLLDRAVAVPLAGRSVLSFAPADALLHLSLHAAASGGDLLGWVRDVYAVAGPAFDWDALLARALQTRTGVPAATMLLRAQDLLDLPVPPGVLPALARGRSWRAIVAGAQRWDDVARGS
ncbi:MAG: hypothetical protein JWL64_1533, partial [Frankiales bacterium]|nr:hypothetical protein [Frankiales bacterium]